MDKNRSAGHVRGTHPFRLEIERVLDGFRNGIHRSVLVGLGMEFKSLHPYDPTVDAPASIDWIASARQSVDDAELVSRGYERERAISVLFLVDDGVSMQHPPKKQECAAFLLWLFAVSAFKHQDRFRSVFFSSERTVSSEWLTREESLEAFFSDEDLRRRKMNAPRQANLLLYLEDFRLHDALVVVVSDFWGDEWQNDAFRLRYLAFAEEKNIRMVYFALDEWSGFSPVPFSATLRNPLDGSSRLFSLRSGGEAAAQKEAQQARFIAAKKALHVADAPFIPLSILGDFSQEVYRSLLKHGFE